MWGRRIQIRDLSIISTSSTSVEHDSDGEKKKLYYLMGKKRAFV